MRACINCQKRKSRCVRSGTGAEDAPCSYCLRTGKSCSFENPPDRTPLTRKNLDAAEHRCRQLRSLLRSLNPDVDIDTTLGQLAAQADPDPLPTGPEESDDSSPHNYEWHEGSLSPESKQDESIGTDGMATISTNDSGYLGSSSGSHLLGEIDSVISNVTRLEQRKTRRKVYPHPPSAGAPGPDPMDLPISYTTGRLVDAFFLMYNTSYPILHEKTFRNRIATGQLQRIPHSPWRVLYYMVLAIGHWVSSDESDHLQTNYYTAARANLSLQILESGTVESVQAFLLMGNYLQKRDRTNTGYNFIGLAYRMALGLGLHREPPAPTNTIGHERRRQIFWTLYCFESGFNITTGRPPSVSDIFIDTRLPLNIDDKDLPFKSAVPQELNVPTTYSAIIAQARLAKIADNIYREFLLARSAGSKIEYRLAESLEKDLKSWHQQLPEYFTAPETLSWFLGPRAVVLWKEQNLRILLWRGSQEYHSFLPTRAGASEKCLDAAMQTIHDISMFCMGYKDAMYQGLSWYATYFIFQATLVLEANSINQGGQGQTAQECSPWQHSIQEARSCLQMLAEKSRSAKRYLELLENIQSKLQSRGQDDLSMGQPLPVSMNAQANTGAPAPDLCMDLSSENEFAFYDFGHQQTLAEDISDPSMRLVLNEISLDFMENMPLDLLLSDWAT